MKTLLLAVCAVLVASPLLAQPCQPGSASETGAEMCLLCLPGTFSPIVGATSCTLCAAGTFSGDSGAIVCDPCAPGTFAPFPGAAACLPCPADTFSIGAASACTACPPGTTAPPGSFLCTAGPTTTTTTLPGPCSPDPCLNGGTCLATDSGGYACVCAPGFSGANCEIPSGTTTTSTTESTTTTTTLTTTTTTTSTLPSTSTTTTLTTTTSSSTTTTAPTTTTTTLTTTTSTAPTTTTTSTTTTITASTTTTAPPLCGAAPATGCRLARPGAASIRIKDYSDDTRDQLKWKWNRGAATGVGDFKDPVNGAATYRVCLYDASSDPQPLLQADVPPASICGTRPCWRSSGSTAYLYKSKTGAPDGLTGLTLRSGAPGRAQVQAKGGGVNLDLPPLGLTLPVIVQLLIRDGVSTECWQTTFTTASVNHTAKFGAKGP